MPSPSHAQALVDKLRDLPESKLAEVEDFIDFLRHKQQRAATTAEERLRIAADAGLITPPEPGYQRSALASSPPISIPGRPLSEIVLEDRR